MSLSADDAGFVMVDMRPAPVPSLAPDSARGDNASVSFIWEVLSD
jgi:hypothetical protein